MNCEPMATHADPVWRSRSDHVIAAAIDPGDTDYDVEQLWARRIDQTHFEICCIPFFMYDVALGDIVEVDAELSFVRVTEPSGRYVFRVYLGRSSDPADELVEALRGMGSLVEWSSDILLAVDAASRVEAQHVADFLHGRVEADRLTYETGRLQPES
jgi:hypothetical protein